MRPLLLTATFAAAIAVVPAWSFSPVRPPWIEEIFLGADQDEVPVNVQPVVLWGRSNGGDGLFIWDEDGRPVSLTREIHQGSYTRLVPNEHLAPGTYQLASVHGKPEGALDTATADTSTDSASFESGETGHSGAVWDTSDTGYYGSSARWADGIWFTVVDEVDEEAPDAPVVTAWSIIEQEDPADTGYAYTGGNDTSWLNPYLYESLRLELEDPSEAVTLHVAFQPVASNEGGRQEMRVMYEGGVHFLWLVEAFGAGTFDLHYIDRAGNASDSVTLTWEPVVVPESTGDTGEPGMVDSWPRGDSGEWGNDADTAFTTDSPSCDGCQQGTGPSGVGILGFATLLGWRRRRR